VADPGALPAILAIDGGNSKTDVALIGTDGTVIASLRGPGTSQERLGVEGAMSELEPLVRAVSGSTDGPVATHTCACLAGADLPSEEEALAEAVRSRGWSHTSVVLNDTFAILRAGVSLSDGERPWGVAVVCGAGINCVGVAPDGKTTRFLAFGSLTGDWGAGEGLSQQVLWHSMRAEDGRGEPTALREATMAYFGMGSVSDVAIAVHTGKISETEVFGLATVLFAAASEGDEIATELVRRQGEEICLMIRTAIGRLGLNPSGEIPVILGGGILQARNPVLTSTITERLAEIAPGSKPRIVDTPPLTGAALLGLDYLAAAESGARVTSPAAEQRLRETIEWSTTPSRTP
jgi:N-acetylglucosamine kinase-like BadF-type ATPase